MRGPMHARCRLLSLTTSPTTMDMPVQEAHRTWPSRAYLALIATITLAVAAVVAGVVGGTQYRALGNLGNGDPGTVVRTGEWLMRLVSDAGAAMCVGALAFALLFSRPDSFDGAQDVLVGRGYRAVRSAARWAVIWAIGAVGSMVFSAAGDAGLRIGQVPGLAGWRVLVRAQEEPLGWFASAIGIIVVAIAATAIQQWRSVAAVLALAVLCLLPPLFGGHSASESGHDYALAAIMLHVPAATIWVGVAVAVFREIGRRPVVAPVLLRRWSQVSWTCWAVVVGSGLVDAGVLDPGFDVRSAHGRAVAGVTGLALVIASGGATLRRRALRAKVSGGSTRQLVWCAAAELLLLAAAFGASAESSQLTPSAFQRSVPVSIQQTLLGYDLPNPPTLARLAFDWRVEVLFAALTLSAAGWYAVALLRVHRQGDHWPFGRSIAWFGGCTLTLVATSSGLGRYEPALFSVHMASGMLLGFVVPLFLALGGPLTLARLTARPTPRGLPGPDDWIGIIDRSPFARVITHPVTALGLLVGTPFVVYFGGVFDAAARFHWAHIALDAVFFAVGYAFAWVVVGIDPLPRPVPNVARLGMLIAAAPFCAVFAGLVMTTHRVLGNGLAAGNMYSALLLWPHNLLDDQRAGGLVALFIGDLTLFVALVAVLMRWTSNDDEMDDAAGPVLGAARVSA